MARRTTPCATGRRRTSSRAVQQPQRARFGTGPNLCGKQLNQFAPRKVSQWDREPLVFTH